MIEIKPLLTTDRDKVQYYWQTLAMHDSLKYRLSDVEDPTWYNVLELIRKQGNHMYMVLEDDTIKGEFSLEGFSGKSAQIHFSMHPELKMFETLKIAKCAVNTVLARWKSLDNDLDPYLDSLYGLTPVYNRCACIFVLKTGFVKLGLIKSACNYLGNVCDGMVTVLTREQLRGIR